MPDKSLLTISGTQISALFDCNPYVTQWLLWRVFAGMDELPDLDSDDNERMKWGLLLERAIFDEALRQLNVEGEYNEHDEYVRHATLQIGATPDGLCFHPSRGMAVVQVKNVDWLVWKDKWSADQAPPYIELQLQHEMLVKEAKWGVIACLVGGNELHLYERDPNVELQAEMTEKTKQFFASVKKGDTPDPLGMPVELPKLLEIRRKGVEVIDLEADEKVHDAMHAVAYYMPRETEAKKALKAAKAILMAKSESADMVLGYGFGCKITVSDTPATTVELPGDIAADLLSALTLSGIEASDPTLYEAVLAATNWQKVTRKAGHRTAYKVFPRLTEDEPSWLQGFDRLLQG